AKVVLALVVVIAAASCTVGHPAALTGAPGLVPAAFSARNKSAEPPERWWRAFGDDELDALVEEAISDNLTIAAAWARLKQARAVAIKAGAARGVSLSAEGGASTTRRRASGQPPSSGRSTTTTDDFSLKLAAAYEVDFWGRLRSAEQAAVLDAEASRADVETAAMTVAASVVYHWLGIVEARAEKKLIEEQIESNRTYLDLLKLRFSKSMATALDLDQQRQVLAGLEAMVPLVEAREETLLHGLALLMGRAPLDVPLVKTLTLPALPELPDTGVPADLVTRRGDVASALSRLEAANRRVAAADADRLPTIGLSASGAFAADALEDIFKNWFVMLASKIAVPILDGGRRRGEIERTQAVTQERLADYRRIVLRAVGEVEDALVSEEKQRLHVQALEKQYKYARLALNEARARYGKGECDYLRVLTALGALQGVERNLVGARRDCLAFRVDLCRALGGYWMHELEMPGNHRDTDIGPEEKEQK
ncbi:MAG: efflux transporter outer membrane subunit, partial [Planctomycetes bacterium]|nr:efflux transporter outer membrane subunit [Planctomycetota bacterium]